MKFQRVCVPAFSLVECVMALGILSLALSSLFGVLSLSMNTTRESVDESVRARLVREIATEVGNAPSLSAFSAEQVRFFDADGLPTTQPLSVYSVAMRAANSVGINPVGATTSVGRQSANMIELEFALAKNRPASLSAGRSPNANDQQFTILVRRP